MKVSNGMLCLTRRSQVSPGSAIGGLGALGASRVIGLEALREHIRIKSVLINVSATFPSLCQCWN